MSTEKTAEGGAVSTAPETAKEKPGKPTLKAVAMTAVLALAPVDPSKPQRYRVWAHGDLRHDGQLFPAGTVLELLPEARKALKLEDVLEPA